jgi:hypothetical protein
MQYIPQINKVRQERNFTILLLPAKKLIQATSGRRVDRPRHWSDGRLADYCDICMTGLPWQVTWESRSKTSFWTSVGKVE